jgi:predicted RNA-binding protein with PUA-like domain
MNHWLMKTEPDEFSIDDLAKRKTEPWSGVRNFQARNYMREMKKGDLVFFYHSSCAEPGVVGVAEVSKEAHVDPTQFDAKGDYYDDKSKREDPRWSMVEVKFKKKLKRNITLTELKTKRELKELILLRPGNRLSVSPVSKKDWDFILELE